MRVHWLLVVLSLGACARNVRAPVGTLEGVTLALVSSPALRLQVIGHLNERSAVVQLDPAGPMSFVTTGCGPSPLGHRVKAPDPFGPDETFQLVSVDGLEVAGVRLAAFAPGLIEGTGCLVVLGSDVLKGLALEVQVAARTVSFRATASADLWLAKMPPGDEVQTLPLTKDPRHDWPLLAAQIRQGEALFTGPLLFSTHESRTRLYEVPAREAGLKPGLELLDGLPLPEDLKLPKSLEAIKSFAVDAVELAPGFGVSNLMLEPEKGAPPHLAQGVLGADVWGRFDSVIDVSGGVVVLHRPRVLVSGARAQCERGGSVSEEACFELHSRPLDGGVEVGLAVWRALPNGARVTLDLEGVSGAPCRVGITFPATDRGRNTAHRLPWTRLKDALPACGEALSHATAATPGLFEEGSLPGCPGTCAFAYEVTSGRMTCECQPTRSGLDETEEKHLLELYRQVLQRQPGGTTPEPEDP